MIRSLFGSLFKNKVYNPPTGGSLQFEDGFKEGFRVGFEKACEWIGPYIQKVDEKIVEKVRNTTIEETRKRLEPFLNGNKVRQD